MASTNGPPAPPERTTPAPSPPTNATPDTPNRQQPTTTQTPTTPSARRSTEPHLATNPALTNATTTPNIANPHDESVMFSVPDVALASAATADEYRKHVQELHKQMCGGDTAEYVETRIALPRSLHGLRTCQVMAKIFTLNPSLNTDTWSAIMADVIGPNLVVGTMCEETKKRLNELKEIKVEPGRSAKVPPASKPNNLYYVELLLPYERELHVDLMGAFLRRFPSGKHISMPGKRAWGTTRRLRLFFNSTTAPREVFLESDANTPVREVVLPCGTAAQVIHKWQRLNQARPPHLANKWNPAPTSRSYASALRGNNQQHPPQDPRLASLRLNNPAPGTQHTQPTQQARATSSAPLSHPGAAISNAPSQTHEGTDDWTSNAPLDTSSPPQLGPSKMHPLQKESTNLTAPRQINSETMNDTVDPAQNDDPRPVMTVTGAPRQPSPRATISHQNPPKTPPPQATTVPTHHIMDNQRTNTAKAPTPPTQHNHPPTTASGAPTVNGTPDVQPTTHIRTPKSSASHPAPTRNTSDPTQWQQPKRARIRKPQPTAAAAANTATLQRSGSRQRRPKTSNSFTPLYFEILPTFEDEPVSPIRVDLPTLSKKSPRGKYKLPKKAWTKPVTDAGNHPQELRHPMQLLHHLSPPQTQALVQSNQETMKPIREKLLRQIALLRAARANPTQKQIHLDDTSDESFVLQVQARLSECQDPPPCTTLTPIDIPLSALLDRDQTRVRGAMCFAWVDLATRAILPELYDIWPDRPTWCGATLTWLPARDSDTPCLQDESLATLAACPTLQPIWTHISQHAKDLETARRTAANQLRLFTTAQRTLPHSGITPETLP